MSAISRHLREALLEEHSKAQTLRVADWIGSNPRRFAALVEVVRSDEAKLAQRGSWVLSYCAEAQPGVVEPFLKELLENLRQPGLHDAIKRNTMKMLTAQLIPDEIAGLAVDLAFHFLSDDSEAVAIRAYSMTVLQRACELEPALANEVIIALEELLTFNKKPAFQSRARSVLKALRKIRGRMGESL